MKTLERKIAEAITYLVVRNVDPGTLVLPDYIKEGRVDSDVTLSDLLYDYRGKNADKQIETILNSVLMNAEVHGIWPMAILDVYIYDLTWWIRYIPGYDKRHGERRCTK